MKVKLLTLLVAISAINLMAATTFNYSTSVADQTIDGITIQLRKGGGQNDPAVASSTVRLYANNKVTIQGKNIKKISLTFTKNSGKTYASMSVDVGTLTSGGNSTSINDAKTDIWTGSANSVNFTIGSTGQRILKTIIVETETSSSGGEGGGESSGGTNNVITYTATEKLTRSSLNVGQTTFGPAIKSHTFSNGKGTITCNGEITTIGIGAFYGCSGLISVTIPNSVTTIREVAFDNCTSLTSVTIPNSVTTIGNDAFYGCTSLPVIDNIRYADTYLVGAVNKTLSTYTIREGTKWIRELAFYNCSGMTSITIPNSVTTIGDEAFSGCNGLDSVIIPNSVTTIGKRAFSNCNNLTDITIGSSVTTIGDKAFYGCRSFSVTIPHSVTMIGDSAFCGCNNLASVSLNSNAICSKSYTKSSNIKNIFGAQVKEYIIGNSVTTIGKRAFYGCSVLDSVTISNSVITIGDSAFYNCFGLTSVSIPNSVTFIGDNAFYDCSKLTTPIFNANCFAYMPIHQYGTYTIPDGIKQIAGGAFAYRSGLTSVTIPNSVTTIGDGAFSGCRGLTSIEIPNSVITIGNYAFINCSGLTSVIIGNSVTTIGNNAFENCSSLTSVTIGNSVTTIGDRAFWYCRNIMSVTWNAKNATILSLSTNNSPFYDSRSQITSFLFGNEVECIPPSLCVDMSKVTSITIPNSVTMIGESAFRSCNGLISIIIGNSVTTIGNHAFDGCSGLTMVTIPNSVHTIGNYAFRGCSGLTSVIIPNSVTTIGKEAFYRCSGLTSITIGNSVTTIGEFAFDGCSGLTKTNYMGTIADWCKIKFGSSSANPMCYSHNFYINDVEVKDLVIPNSITKIGDYSFFYCTGLTSVTIPPTVTTIGNEAFENCNSLRTITCYATNPPAVGLETFDGVGQNTKVYVLASSLEDYQFDFEWQYLNLLPIEANEQTIIDNEVTVVPTNNQATFTWPANDQAAGYSIEITKDGVVFCTLKFNAQGQLTGIAFAPSRDGAREMASAEMTANGWQFTVTGLNQASKYNYTIDVLDASQQSIKQYKGEFTTTGGISTDLEGLTIDGSQCTMKKMIIDNQLFIRRDNELYNAMGQKVR